MWQTAAGSYVVCAAVIRGGVGCWCALSRFRSEWMWARIKKGFQGFYPLGVPLDWHGSGLSQCCGLPRKPPTAKLTVGGRPAGPASTTRTIWRSLPVRRRAPRPLSALPRPWTRWITCPRLRVGQAGTQTNGFLPCKKVGGGEQGLIFWGPAETASAFQGQPCVGGEVATLASLVLPVHQRRLVWSAGYTDPNLCLPDTLASNMAVEVGGGGSPTSSGET